MKSPHTDDTTTRALRERPLRLVPHPGRLREHAEELRTAGRKEGLSPQTIEEGIRSFENARRQGQAVGVIINSIFGRK